VATRLWLALLYAEAAALQMRPHAVRRTAWKGSVQESAPQRLRRPLRQQQVRRRLGAPRKHELLLPLLWTRPLLLSLLLPPVRSHHAGTT